VFGQIDPFAGDYTNVSPYMYCAGNPINAIDPDGREVRPANKQSLTMIKNTLPKKDRKYVQMGKDGSINKDRMNSHSSESGNYNSLSELVNSGTSIEVSLGSEVTSVDNNGNTQTITMGYQEASSEFVDSDGSTPSGTTTGEAGYMGQTLLPGTGESDMNSPDNSIKIIVNENLSPAAQAETYSHEANGHGLMYVRTSDRAQSGHKFGKGMIDKNTPLKNMIKQSKQETIKNMKGR
jgi:hypothetical protein